MVGTTNSLAGLRGGLLAAKFQIARRFRRNFPEGERSVRRWGGPLYTGGWEALLGVEREG